MLNMCLTDQLFFLQTDIKFQELKVNLYQENISYLKIHTENHTKKHMKNLRSLKQRKKVQFITIVDDKCDKLINTNVLRTCRKQ